MKRNLLALSIIAGGYVFLWFSALTNADHSYTICIFKNLTGHPCPGCGMGRASIELFQGHWGESLHFHWLAVPFHAFVLVSVVWIIRDMVKSSDSYWKFIRRPLNSWVLAPILLLVLVNWIRALYLNL